MRELRTTYEAEHRYSHQGAGGLAKVRRGLAIRFGNFPSPPEREENRITFRISLGPHERWHCCVDFIPEIEEQQLLPQYQCRSFFTADNDFERKTAIFMSEATRFSNAESQTLAPVVVGALEQGKRDLAALRLFDLDTGDRAWTVAAGLPLYVALFGRDTLTASWEAAMVST